MTIVDRSGPGVRVTLLDNERAPSGEPLDLAGRIIAFTYEDAEKKAARDAREWELERQKEETERLRAEADMPAQPLVVKAVPGLGQHPQQRQPHPAAGGRVQTRPEGLGQHPRVVQGVVRVLLDHAEVRGQ